MNPSEKGRGTTGPSGIRKELQWPQQSYTKGSSIVPVPDWGNISVCQGSAQGLTFQGRVWGCISHSRDTFPSLWALGAALTAPGNVQLHLQQTYWHCVLLQDSNPGISTLDPPNENALLFSAIPKHQVTNCYKPLAFKASAKALNFCADQATCPGLHGEYPSGKLQPAIFTLHSSANKILPYNLDTSSKLSEKFQLYNGNISEIQCPWKGKVMEVVFLLHQ